MVSRGLRTVKSLAKQALPSGLVIGGSILPFVDGGATSGYTSAQSIGNIFTGGGGVSRGTSAADAIYNLKENFKADWWESALLIGGGVVAHKVLSTVR